MLLLMAALAFGWRLDRRLKGLKDSQSDFAGAVADLDRAAQRAEVGLAQLRQATDEAVDLLASRIEKARELAVKLETLTQQSVIVAQRPPNEPPRPSVGAVKARPSAISAPRASAPVDAILAAEALARRLSSDERLIPPAPAAARPTPRLVEPNVQTLRPQDLRPTPRPAAPPSRLRTVIDDDLFETPTRAAAGMRRNG
jgi:hypothetical protein